MDNLFFIFSKVSGLFTTASSLILILLCTGFLLGFTRWQKSGKRLTASVLTATLIIAVLPVDEWLLAPLENRFPVRPVLPAGVDGIIILGGAIDTLQSDDWGQPELNSAADRVTAGLMLAHRYPNARVIFTGGSASMRYPSIREADKAKEWFQLQGLPERQVFFESASRNTFENAVFTHEMAAPGQDEVWILVTSASHMPRATGTFCKQGWSTIPWPVDHNSLPSYKWRLQFDLAGNLGGLDKALHEYQGLIAYALTGKTDSLFPKGCQARQYKE